MGELDIGLIAAHSPQAKGRVERSHGTDQDRLVKELRLAGVSSIEAANRFVEEHYLPQVNERFTVEAAGADAHRSAEGYDLEAIFSIQEQRVVANDYTVRVDGVAWQIERGEITGGLRRTRVIVEKRLDGSMRLRWGDRYLKYHRVQKVCKIKIEEQVGVNGTAPAGVGVASFREGSLCSPIRHCAPPTPANLKHKRKPSPDHPWKKRIFLFCRKKDISTLR